MADDKYMWSLRTNTLHRRHQPEGDKEHGLKRSTKGAMTHAKISATTLPIVLRHHNATRPQPTLRSILHPFNAITGYPRRATVISATRSPREFPTAKMVRPRSESLMLSMTPRVLRTFTTSVASVEIQAIDTAKPRKASSGRDWDGA